MTFELLTKLSHAYSFRFKTRPIVFFCVTIIEKWLFLIVEPIIGLIFSLNTSLLLNFNDRWERVR